MNQYNAARQHAVNAAAEHYGAGTGTAAHYGVPGTISGKELKQADQIFYDILTESCIIIQFWCLN